MGVVILEHFVCWLWIREGYNSCGGFEGVELNIELYKQGRIASQVLVTFKRRLSCEGLAHGFSAFTYNFQTTTY